MSVCIWVDAQTDESLAETNFPPTQNQNTDMKIIKEPKTALEAEMLIQAISDKFGMKTIILSKTDLEDMMGTEGWTNEKMDEALEIAADNLGNQVGYAIDGAIEQIKLNNE